MTDKFIQGQKKFREYMVAKRKERLSNIEVEISDLEEEDQEPPLPEVTRGVGDSGSRRAIKARDHRKEEKEAYKALQDIVPGASKSRVALVRRATSMLIEQEAKIRKLTEEVEREKRYREETEKKLNMK
ncbi:unnamed protein product [Mucor hiemalis]